MRPPSPLSDLLRAWHQMLPVDDDARAAIARAIGVAWAPEMKTVEPKKVLVKPIQPSVESKVVQPQPRPNGMPERVRGQKRDLVMEVLDAPEEETQEEVVGKATLDLSIPLEEMPAKPSLLTPSWMRGIFSTRLSRRVEGAETDIERLVEMEARGLALWSIPRKPVQIMTGHVRCYLDRGRPLEILAEDRKHLVRGLRTLVGVRSVTVKSFDALPDEVAWRVEEPEMAVRDSPIVVVTDFGRFRSAGREWASERDWLAWAIREREAGTPSIVALTPLDRSNWPVALTELVEILSWDRSTSARPVGRLG